MHDLLGPPLPLLYLSPFPMIRPLFAAVLLAGLAHSQVSFTNRAPAAGLDDLSHGRGAAMVDLDQDGLLDVVAINTGMANQFYRQTSLGTFVDVTAAWGLVPDTRQHWSGVVADFDNDGDDDVYIATGGFLYSEANQLLRNDLGTTGKITDVSAFAQDAAIVAQNFGATTQDFDNDGDLDLFLTTSDEQSRCLFLDNQGDGTFVDVSIAVGLFHKGNFMHCSSGDFDNDGWADVGAGNLVGLNVLYRNKGNGTFKDLAAQMGVTSPKNNFGLVLEDFNNDGFLDLFVPKYNNKKPATDSTELYVNDTVGKFVDVSSGLGLTPSTDMGHTTGDVDGDGYPDIYIGTGNPAKELPDLLYLVTPNGAGALNFNDVSATSGILSEGDTRAHGMALGDYDGDGMIDVFVNNGGPSEIPATLEEHFLFHAADNGSHWAGFELTGIRSNRSAVGAHLTATTSTGRQVHRWRRVGHGFGNTNSPIQHVAIGSDTSIERLDIRWPSGIVQTILEPALSTVHQVLETGLLVSGPTTVGGQVALEAVGPAGQTLQLYTSGATFQLPLPGLGLLQLLPPLTSLGSLPLDAAGTGAASLPIPANPALAGLTVYLQGWFHDPVTFGNSTLSNALTITIG